MNHFAKIAMIGGLLVSSTAVSQTTAITGATVHTVGPQGTIDNATILVADGKIVAVGTGIEVPDDAEVIDASDKIITPGLFSPLGQHGLVEVSAVQGSNDATQRGDQFSASFDVANAYNPRSLVIAVSRMDGITRAAITPVAAPPDPEGNSSSVLSGLGSIVQLGSDDEYLVKRGAVVVANFGETGSSVAGGSRAAAVMVLHAALTDALDYRTNKAAADRGDWREYSVSIADLQVLQRVLDGSIPLLIKANRASDISVVLDLAAEFGVRVIVAGGAEAWMVADAVAAAGAPIILDAINNLPSNFDKINARLDSANLLVNAGVTVAFDGGALGPGNQTHNARNITQAAGIAVANGLSWDEALKAITLVPAQIYGVDAIAGSLEIGKDADIVIWQADPLELTSYPEQVYIQGAAVSMQSRQTLLRDRYLQSDSEIPPAYRN